MQNVMLDLETLGHGNRAVILSIGACHFDPEQDKILSTFYTNVDPQSCVESGLQMDVSTIMWWMQQSDAARAVFKEPTLALNAALLEFTTWVSNIAPASEIRVWGNGSTFDNVVIRSAFAAWGMDPPWSFRQDACYRTLKNLHPQIAPPPTTGTAHNALDDAKYQAVHAMRILRNMQCR